MVDHQIRELRAETTTKLSTQFQLHNNLVPQVATIMCVTPQQQLLYTYLIWYTAVIKTLCWSFHDHKESIQRSTRPVQPSDSRYYIAGQTKKFAILQVSLCHDQILDIHFLHFHTQQGFPGYLAKFQLIYYVSIRTWILDLYFQEIMAANIFSCSESWLRT